ncbi:hypothetical protein GCM10009801_51200 [Streptomyces albiaxialis]|uniref:Uncharacterized protein n=1 Tax=Streptomyces albiaxialis TaxID=329523 RepID=A0ABN2WAH2_9ACTN
MAGQEPTAQDFRDAADEMAATGHPFLARELIAEAERLENPDTRTDEES